MSIEYTSSALSTDEMLWNTEIPHLCRNGTDSLPLVIATLFAQLGGHYTSPEEMKKTFVKRMGWFKNNEGLEHEFLVLIVDNDIEQDALLRFERKPSHDLALTKEYVIGKEAAANLRKETGDALAGDIKSEQQAMTRSRRDVKAKAQKVSDKKQCVQASDTITRIGQSPFEPPSQRSNDAVLVRSYWFNGALSLRDFVFAAYSVSTFSDNYLMFLQQCYWFCRTTVGVILKHYVPTKTEDGAALNVSGVYTTKARPKVAFRVNEDNNDEVDGISVKFQELIAKNDKAINERFQKGAGGKEEERKRGDDEKRNRECAERTAADDKLVTKKLKAENEKLRKEIEELQSKVHGLGG